MPLLSSSQNTTNPTETSPEPAGGTILHPRWKELSDTTAESTTETDASETSSTPMVQQSTLAVPEQTAKDDRGRLSAMDSSDGDSLLRVALGMADSEDLPAVFSREHATRLVKYIEGNTKQLEPLMRDNLVQRAEIATWADSMLKKNRESSRWDLLLRWFRDPAAPADAKGIRLIHPVAFNLCLSVILVVVAIGIFALYFRLPN